LMLVRQCEQVERLRIAEPGARGLFEEARPLGPVDRRPRAVLRRIFKHLRHVFVESCRSDPRLAFAWRRPNAKRTSKNLRENRLMAGAVQRQQEYAAQTAIATAHAAGLPQTVGRGFELLVVKQIECREKQRRGERLVQLPGGALAGIDLL